MEFVAELLFTFILAYPGAFVRWLTVDREKKFKAILEEHGYSCYVIGSMIVSVFAYLIYLVLSAR